MSTIHYPAKSYDSLNRQQLLQVAYALEDTRDRALRRLEAIEGKPGADWADVREMARKAGWTVGPDKTLPSTLKLPTRAWGRRENGWLDTRHGWVRAEMILLGMRRIDVIGPAAHPFRSVSLVDPSPAEILTAARLVGLTGSES